jgi:hypothetical protein
MQLAQSKATIKGLFLALGVAGLAACGSGDEAGGGGSCGGVDESGICLQVSLIETLHLDESLTTDVDVNFIPDCDGDPTTVDPEPFTEHFADVTFSASLVSGTPVAASFVQITNMTVTFTQNTTDPVVTCTAGAFAPNCNAVAVAGPAIFPLTTPIDVAIPVGTSVTQLMSMVNFQRKDDYTPAVDFNIFPSGPFDPSVTPAYLSYHVRFVFTGEDEFGNSVDATGATEITFGAYSFC